MSVSLGQTLLEQCVGASQHSLMMPAGLDLDRKVVFYIVENVCVLDDPEYIKKIPLDFCRATIVPCTITADKLQAVLAELCHVPEQIRDDKCLFYLLQKDERPLPLSDNKILHHALQDGDIPNQCKNLVAQWPRLYHTIRASLHSKKPRGKKRTITEKLLDLQLPVELVETLTSSLNESLAVEFKEVLRSRERCIETDSQLVYMREQARINILTKMKYAIDSIESEKRAMCISELKEYINKFFRNRMSRLRKSKMIHVHSDGIVAANMIVDSDNEHNPWWSRKIE
eukprot:TRINITY_DN2476_c0_g1_i10.p1 TRINITY_DN2476_c0_g1~~TRINITY_DN2476_c0_g1_i10.p1  ORF type:complete len:285 (-),score=43.42 TRINITY_DN2476_c0_g1_i10:522-1376(-)